MGTVINEPMSSSINHQDALKVLNLKVGDTVLVTAKAESYKRGWNNYWTPEMSNCVGKEFTVVRTDVTMTGVKLRTSPFWYSFPAFVLAKVVSQQPTKTASSSSFAAAVDDLKSQVQSLEGIKSTSTDAVAYGPNTYLLIG